MTADILGLEIPEETQKEARARGELEQAYKLQKIDLSIEQQDFVDTKLSSKLWRLSNCYTIRNKDSVKMIMRLNPSQYKILTQFSHIKKIILKSRQQGISTLFLGYYLDSCLFTPGFQAGIQSYGQDEADKLAKRALLMWDELDENIKVILGIKLVSNNSRGMTFSNGSILKIGNFRGDTLQGLHVSELGKIAKKYPEKARELKTGAFQAVGKNSRITIESTAEGNYGMFYDMWIKAVLKKAAGTPLTSFDFEPIFLSWLEDPDCNLPISYTLDKELNSYFDTLEKKLNIIILDSQKAWYQSKVEELGDDMKQEYPSYPEEAFEQSVEGTIFRKEYESLIKDGRYHPLVINKKLPTYVSYDIGVNDETVLTFVQLIYERPHIVFTYANSRENLEFYVDIMKASGYNINMVYLPHDANVQEFSSGRTRIEEFRKLRVPCRLLKRQSIKDYNNALRSFLKVAVINSEGAESTMKSIQLYRWKYDKTLGVYLQTPLHDEHSNYMDSLKYMAIGIHYSKTLGNYIRIDNQGKEPIDLWELNDLIYSTPGKSNYAV